MRARVVLVVIALIAAFVAIGTRPAGAIPPTPAPTYLTDDYASIGLWSNSSWQGAKILPGTWSPLYILNAKANPEVFGPVWAPTCAPGSQTVTFTRDVWLPGPPSRYAQFQISRWVGASSVLRSALVWADLVVNGKVISHVTSLRDHSSATVNLDARMQAAFRPEQNTIQVRVQKAPTAGGCNKSKTDQLGVEFVLRGSNAVDGALNPPQTVYYKYTLNSTQSSITTLTFFNKGPGMIVKGRFHALVYGATRVAVGSGQTAVLPAPGPPLSNCTTKNSGPQYDVACDLTNFLPNTSGSLTITYQVPTQTQDFTDFSTSLGWDIVDGVGVTDPDPSNNQSGATIVWCGIKSTKPGCASAVPPGS